MAVKLVPGGHPHHALAEAAANAARDGGFTADEIETITLSRPGLTALAGPLHPADLIDMAHSPAYFLAAGAADRDFSWVHATPAKIADPVIHRLIDKVHVGPPPTDNVERYRQGATVTIRTTDGRDRHQHRLRAERGGDARHRLGRHRRQIPRAGAVCRGCRPSRSNRASR